MNKGKKLSVPEELSAQGYIYDKDQVAEKIGVCKQTINIWYRFKKRAVNNELANLLPEPAQSRPTGRLLWRKQDIKALLKFKELLPRGNKGKIQSTIKRGKKE